MRRDAVRESKSYYGVYRALVVDNMDPKKLGRLKLKVPELFGDIVTDWASLCTPYGGSSNIGSMFIPQVNASVVVMFEGGSPNRPIWIGTWYGENESPTSARDGSDSVHSSKGNDSFEDSYLNNVEEFERVSGTQYPNSNVIKTKSGHLVELDDTPGRETVSINHKSGACIEIDAEGRVRIISKGESYTLVEGDSSTHCNGDKKVKAEGDLDIRADGIATVSSPSGIMIASDIPLVGGGETSMYVKLDPDTSGENPDSGAIVISAPVEVRIVTEGVVSFRCAAFMINDKHWDPNR